jgi:hypothetical protein
MWLRRGSPAPSEDRGLQVRAAGSNVIISHRLVLDADVEDHGPKPNQSLDHLSIIDADDRHAVVRPPYDEGVEHRRIPVRFKRRTRLGAPAVTRAAKIGPAAARKPLLAKVRNLSARGVDAQPPSRQAGRYADQRACLHCIYPVHIPRSFGISREIMITLFRRASGGVMAP